MTSVERRWALPEVHAAVDSLVGWHQWLGLGHIALAAAEMALAKGGGDAAVAASTDALHRAPTVGLLKYEALGLDALARSLATVGRPEDARAASEQAVAAAGRLRHPPTSWRTQTTLARLLRATGDDGRARSVATSASELVAQFASSLTPLRRDTFLAAPGTVRTLDALADLA